LNPPFPFVKWAGGKGQHLSQFEPHLPASFRGYIEPFVGGGALFFHLYRQGRLSGKDIILIDRVEELINAFRVVQNQVEDLIAELQRHEPHKQDADYYYQVRAWDRQPGYALRSGVERAARFLFLNRVCYNGLYRVNRRGYFNVPFGRHHNPKVCDVVNLRAASRALRGATLLAADFADALQWAREGDLVYLDPPYHPLTATANFTSYTASSFGIDDQKRLAHLFRDLDRRGCHLLLSNSSTPLIQDLYRGYVQIEVTGTRAISSKSTSRGAITELLVTNHKSLHQALEDGTTSRVEKQ
jgi:DNA adenine methylase